MAPVTRHFLESLKPEEHLTSRCGVHAGLARYRPLRLVHSTLHLNQVESDLTIKKLPKLRLKSAKKTHGRIIRSMTFSAFNSEMLMKPSTEGNVSFIVDMKKLLARFPLVYDAGVTTSADDCTQTILLTRRHRDVSRYTPLVRATPQTPGEVWWQDGEQNFILCPQNSKLQRFNLKMEVDVQPSDYKWFKRQAVCELVDHSECPQFGDMCSSLLQRTDVWHAIHFS